MRILIVDDHPLIRAGLVALMENEPNLAICGSASNGREARKLVQSLQPDVTLLDLMLGDEDGLTLIRELRNLAPNMRVVVLSMLNPQHYAARAIAAGAYAYVDKSDGLDTLAAVMVQLSQTEAGEDSPTTPESVDDSPIAKLSDRELQVLALIGRGRTTREISSALGVSPKTIDAHKEHIKLRLGLENATQLTAFAARWIEAQKTAPDI
jgi:DNA-binding NarL/FixJ family response regulator